MQEDQVSARAVIDRPSNQVRKKATHRPRQYALSQLIKQKKDEKHHMKARPAMISIARLEKHSGDGSWQLLNSNGIPICARRAESCLLEPLQGDLVQLLADDTSGWIVAILERSAQHVTAEINFSGRNLVVRTGSLDVQASRNIRSQADTIHSVAEVIREVSAEKSSLIREASLIQCGSLSVNADRHISAHSKLATIAADALLKLDGTQIHMG
jgi:hypothetical protein